MANTGAHARLQWITKERHNYTSLLSSPNTAVHEVCGITRGILRCPRHTDINRQPLTVLVGAVLKKLVPQGLDGVPVLKVIAPCEHYPAQSQSSSTSHYCI